MVRVGEEHALELAEMAVEETGFGIVDDKVYKNHMATGMLYESIKDMKTVGIINEDDEKKTVELAVPVGLVMGIIPSTNPTSTPRDRTRSFCHNSERQNQADHPQ